MVLTWGKAHQTPPEGGVCDRVLSEEVAPSFHLLFQDSHQQGHTCSSEVTGQGTDGAAPHLSSRRWGARTAGGASHPVGQLPAKAAP